MSKNYQDLPTEVTVEYAICRSVYPNGAEFWLIGHGNRTNGQWEFIEEYNSREQLEEAIVNRIRLDIE